MRLLPFILVSGIGAAELAVSPERVIIDARQAAPAAVEVTLGVTGQTTLPLNVEIVDPLAGVAAGKPNYPFTISLAPARAAPSAPARLTVAYTPENGSGVYALRAWQIVSNTIRVRTGEADGGVYDIPVAIRNHALPLVQPRTPTAQPDGQGLAFDFTVRSGNPEERIASIALDSARLLDSTGSTPLQATLTTAAGGACRVSTGIAPDGLAGIDLLITYDQPAPAKKLLSLRCRVGKGSPSRPQPDAAAPDEPSETPKRRLRIE